MPPFAELSDLPGAGWGGVRREGPPETSVRQTKGGAGGERGAGQNGPQLCQVTGGRQSPLGAIRGQSWTPGPVSPGSRLVTSEMPSDAVAGVCHGKQGLPPAGRVPQPLGDAVRSPGQGGSWCDSQALPHGGAWASCRRPWEPAWAGACYWFTVGAGVLPARLARGLKWR